MIDEPYVPLLPWVVFAIVDGTTHDATVWAAIAACGMSLLLLLAPRRVSVGLPNVLMGGAVAWYGAFVIACLVWSDPGSWLDRYSLAASAIGFTVIAFGSLAGTPFTEYFTRLAARRRHWTLPSFKRANVQTTMLWGVLFAAAAASHVVAAAFHTAATNTIFNWLVPLGFGVFVAYQTRSRWIEFIEETIDDHSGPETLWGLTYDDD